MASARSVPGSGLQVERRARGVGVRRGSTTMCRAPRGGRRRSTASPAASSRPGWSRRGGSPRPRRGRPGGNGSPRSTPKARFPPWRPTTCRTGRCSRSCWYAAPLGRTCRAGTPSRWSARRRRSSRPRRPCAAWVGGSPVTIGPAPRPRWPGRNGLVRSPGTVRSSGRAGAAGGRGGRWRSSPWSQAAEVGGEVRLRKQVDGRIAGWSSMTPHCSSAGSAWRRVLGCDTDPTPRWFWCAFRGLGARVNSSSRCAHTVLGGW